MGSWKGTVYRALPNEDAKAWVLPDANNGIPLDSRRCAGRRQASTVGLLGAGADARSARAGRVDFAGLRPENRGGHSR